MFQADIAYTNLRDALQKGDFQLADDITRAVLITLAGPDAEKRTWVYFSEVKFIPATDLQTIDKLWRAASKDRYHHRLRQRHRNCFVVTAFPHNCRLEKRDLSDKSVSRSSAGKASAFRRRFGCKIASNGPSSSNKSTGQ